jgi:HAD superfamily hydrolase (TIGR01509 family)
MALEALIFDLDGTMADTEEAHRQAFNAAFLEHSLFWDWDRPKYTELLKISGGHERLAAYVETLQMPEDEKAGLREMVGPIHRTKTRIYNELITEGKVPLRHGVARLLREARAAGKQLAIVATTAAANVTPLIANALGEDAYYWFKAIVSAEHVAHKKPAPDLYRLVLSELALPASECVAFEDSASGVKAARAVGLFTIVTPTLWTRQQDLAGADLFLYDLGEPDAPLDLRGSSIVGAPYLGLAQLEQLHAAAMERSAVAAG